MKFLLTIVFCISISLISCQKDYIPEGVILDSTTVLPPPVSDSSYIDSIYIYDYFANPNSRDSGYVKVNYDANKRIVLIKDDSSSARAYYYIGTDTLPFLTVGTDIFTTANIDSVYHFYNGAGKIIKDSIVNTNVPSDVAIIKYSYAPNRVYGFTTYLQFGVTYNYYDTSIVDGNGNTTNNVKHRLQGNVETTVNRANYIFDNKLSAFAGRGIVNATQIFPTGETLYFDHLFGNNILSQTEATTNVGLPSPPPYTLQSSHTYYPNNRVKRSVERSGGDSSIYLYKYKKL